MQNALAAALQPFLGTWRLDPREGRYQLGQPPLDGAYTLSYDGERLHFDIEWTAPDGKPQRQAVDALPACSTRRAWATTCPAPDAVESSVTASTSV